MLLLLLKKIMANLNKKQIFLIKIEMIKNWIIIYYFSMDCNQENKLNSRDFLKGKVYLLITKKILLNIAKKVKFVTYFYLTHKIEKSYKKI